MSKYDGLVVRQGHVDFGCPHCNALGDEFCTTPDGIVRDDHQARIVQRSKVTVGQQTEWSNGYQILE